MSPRLPVFSGKRLVQVLEGMGWVVARRRGSHVIMVRDDHVATLSIPDHAEVARGTLRALLRAAGITPREFLETLSRR